ncbi:MAG TPA: DNA-3-methyladenine glycosylase [Gemmatimonadaceae bacterium]|nr:DNA-3-methyladenine glycosylase [Gemmatimonadaceae bacterium]
MHRPAVRHLKRADPRLAAVIERVGPCRLEIRRDGTHFEYVLRAIVYQQLSGKAAGTIHGRVVDLLGGTPTPDAVLGTPDEAFRAAGLSRQKLSYVRDLARQAAAGAVPLETIETLDDEAVIEALASIKGVGRWTAQMFLLFRLGRPNVLPAEDLGIRKGVQLAYRTRGLPPPKRVLALGRAWAPYASVASWYLWRSLELPPTPRA